MFTNNVNIFAVVNLRALQIHIPSIPKVIINKKIQTNLQRVVWIFINYTVV